jgi:hypothetical protein
LVRAAEARTRLRLKPELCGANRRVRSSSSGFDDREHDDPACHLKQNVPGGSHPSATPLESVAGTAPLAGVPQSQARRTAAQSLLGKHNPILQRKMREILAIEERIAGISRR